MSVRMCGVGALVSACGVAFLSCLAAAADPVSVEQKLTAETPKVPLSGSTYTSRSGEMVDYTSMPLLSFTKRGVILNQPVFGNPTDLDTRREPGADGSRGNCDETLTYSSANFSGGGSVVAQAGMAEGESAAASFVIPASHFPIVIRTTECIWATQNATVPTETVYSVIWWAGTPQTGTVVAAFTSDDVILPNISLPVGSSAVNVQIVVDPNDPEQVVILNPGNQTFTVEFRITGHNNPSPNGCVVPTPIASNAFPTTDTNGLASAANNWLFGLNCGPFGCPANGGWAPFASLPAFCRPSGDWNIRVTYERQNCGPATGACCATTGACTELTQAQCGSSGGTYRGDNTTCATQNCPVSTQACCFTSTQSCLDLTPANCTGFGGTLGGSGTSCANFVCFPIGACCLPNGTCQNGLSPTACTGLGGQFRGNATTCATQNCPPPLGACCSATGFCAELTQINCGTIPGAVWKGALTNCLDGNSNGTADACEAAPCPGDFNNDHARNTADLTLLLGKFGQNVTPGSTGDMNNDGTVNTIDLTSMLAVFGVPCP